MKLFGCADLQDQTNVLTFPEAKRVPLTCTLPPQSSDLHCGRFWQIQPAPDRPFSPPSVNVSFLAGRHVWTLVWRRWGMRAEDGFRS